MKMLRRFIVALAMTMAIMVTMTMYQGTTLVLIVFSLVSLTMILERVISHENKQ